MHRSTKHDYLESCYDPALGKQTSASHIFKDIDSKEYSFWETLRHRRALRLFHLAARRVPAYRDFLKKNKINPLKIKTFKDFQLVPPISKKNYLRVYPLEKLLWEGDLEKPLVWTSTSGSTGKPFYFPRSHKLDWECSILIDLFLNNSSNSKGPILVIIAFGMGVWIGGLITYKAFEIASQRRDYSLSIITPGINKEEIFNVLQNLAPYYSQTILVGYPPFVKDIIDEAKTLKINLKKLNLRLLFAAEAFTEKFREYLVKQAGVKNLYLDTLNIYGTADIGAMAWETPLSILIRRLALSRKKLFLNLFHQTEKTPTLAQYNPYFITFEDVDGEIVLTGDNSIPLVRYKVGDRGGVFSFSEIVSFLKAENLSLKKEARLAGISNHIYQLPFVYVYERSDFSTSLYGLQIYPETIREALLHRDLRKNLTGRFTMITKYDKKNNQYLEINLELKDKSKHTRSLYNRAAQLILKNLIKKNSEFRELYNFIKERAIPRLVFWPQGHSLYFKAGIKQKWTRK